MRLIDADELKKKFSERSYWTYTHEHGDAIPIGWIMSGIDHAPTVEPKQGKWDEIREPFGWDDILSARCSVCGESYPYPEETGFNDIVEMFKYCPNCGAKMEAGDRWKEEET